jgi:hypothetical protein
MNDFEREIWLAKPGSTLPYALSGFTQSSQDSWLWDASQSDLWSSQVS